MALSNASGVGFGETTSTEIPNELRRNVAVVVPMAATWATWRVKEGDTGVPDVETLVIRRSKYIRMIGVTKSAAEGAKCTIHHSCSPGYGERQQIRSKE